MAAIRSAAVERPVHRRPRVTLGVAACTIGALLLVLPGFIEEGLLTLTRPRRLPEA